jgi:8-oxo-dGTP diphosphatase
MTKVVVGLITRVNKNAEEEYLLVSSKKESKDHMGAYYPPGGHLEDGESEENCLKREILEELGIEGKVIEKIAETDGDALGYRISWWKVESFIGEVSKSDEIADYGFYTKDQIKNLNLWPATRKFFDQYIFKTNE